MNLISVCFLCLVYCLPAVLTNFTLPTTVENTTLINLEDTTLVNLEATTLVNLEATTLVNLETTTEAYRVLCSIGCRCPEEGQHLIFLDCDGLGISSLPSSLSVDPSISKLSFKSNHMRKLKAGTFSDASSVQELDFSFNAIIDVQNSTLRPFRSLTLLRFSHNHLSDIDEDFLLGLTELRVLELGYNVIQSVSFQAFKATPNLQELRLQYNPLFDLHEDLFRYLPHLEKLDLKETGLVRLPYQLFLPTPRLHWLSLAGNAFENVPNRALSHATSLESLDLSGNDMIVLEQGAFEGLQNVTVLYLNNLNRLVRIEKNSLSGLGKLKSLFCSYNQKLTYISVEAFGGSKSNVTRFKTPPKEQLYLRQNALRTLESPLDPETWPTLSFVDLAENPWKCDCRLLWMANLKLETQASIRCSSPPHLKERTFDTIDLSELQCERRWGLATLALIVASIVAFGAVMLTASMIVCSRSRVGLYIRAKKQFSYAKVIPKIETVDLEWDPSADM